MKEELVLAFKDFILVLARCSDGLLDCLVLIDHVRLRIDICLFCCHDVSLHFGLLCGGLFLNDGELFAERHLHRLDLGIEFGVFIC